MAKITLKNISSATVVIGSTNSTIRSRSLAPGRIITLTPSEYEDLMYEPGIQNMIRGGYIKIDGVQEDRAVIETPTNVKDKDEIIKKAGNILAEKLRRTKRVKEMMEGIVDEYEKAD